MIDWQAFKRGEFAVRCDTEDKARAFLGECEEHKIRWITGEKATKHFKWSQYKHCYSYMGGMVRDNESSYFFEGVSVIDYDQFVNVNKKDEPVSHDQTVKHDAGKPQLTIVPTSLVRATAAVLEFGADKYERDGWRKVGKQRYRDALYRHWLAYLDDPDGVDEESGLPHLWHLAANVAFLVEMEGADV